MEAHRLLTAEVAGSKPARTAQECEEGREAMVAPIWLLDFDGVVNALSRRGGRSYWRDWNSATVEHPDGERTRTGSPVQLPLLWSQTVVDTIAGAADSGVAVRWLSTWREHTQQVPAVIAGLPELPWLDESILDAVGNGELDPQMKQYSGPWDDPSTVGHRSDFTRSRHHPRMDWPPHLNR